MLLVGLTGGIGSGKSTVAAMFAELGAIVIDVDALGRAVLEPGGRAYDAVVAEFGAGILDAAGRIDRAALASQVFDDPAALARLTAISHPAINADLRESIAALPADAVVVLDMAILVESTLGAGLYTTVITVEAPVDVRIARAAARGMAADDVRARMSAQATDAERRARADIVIVNDGDLDTLRSRVREVWADLT